VVRPTGRFALGAWGAFVVVLLALKTFLTFTSALRFGRPLSAGDVACTFGGDALVALALLGTILACRRLAARGGAGSLAALARAASRALLAAAAALLALLLLLYPVAGYVFWEWGAFLQPLHLDAGRMAGVTAGLAEYVFDGKSAIVLGCFALALLLARRLARRVREPQFRRRAIATLAGLSATLALGAFAPLAHPGGFDPSVPSPLLRFVSGLAETAGGLDELAWPRGAGERAPTPPAREIPAEWRDLAGRARDLDVVFVVLESTRRDRVQLYGCERATTPRLLALEGHALVFDEAYVSQPRSCKTMESLALGSYPDPRLLSLTWEQAGCRVAEGGDSLFRRLAEDGRSLYFGTTFEKETDDFDRFVEAAAGRPFERNVGASELGVAAHPEAQVYDDRVLIDDFVAWRAAVGGRCAALLWLAGAHHPYRAIARPFGEAELADRYDNCVWCVDQAIGRLVDSLAALGHDRTTLLVVLGDHGEALGEHQDVLHGSSFYDHSIRIPCLLWNPELFPRARRCDARFTVKDLPATLLWLLGDERPLRESNVLFGNRREDPLFFSNVYQDFKLGRLAGDRKAVFRPERDEIAVFDLAADPGESLDLAPSMPPSELAALKRELVAWYYDRLDALAPLLPPRPARSGSR